MYLLKLLWDILTVALKLLGMVWGMGHIPTM